MPRTPSPYDRRERRSRSPYGRDKDRYRERDRRERRRTPERGGRYRSRSRSPGRRERALNSRTSERDRKDEKYDRERRINKSRSRSPRKDDVSKASGEPSNNVPDDMNLDDDPEQAMMKLMGLTGFGSTKGKKVQGNDFAAVSIKKQRQYRQYMNRRGGFNRPLDKIQ